MANLSAQWRWALGKAVQGAGEHKGLTLLAFAATSLALSLPLIAFTLGRSLYAPVSAISPAQEITVFTNRGTGAEAASELRDKIEAMPAITAARAVTPEEAIKSLDRAAGGAATAGDNPLPHIIIATADTQAADADVKAAADAIRKERGVDSVAFDPTWNSRLAAVKRAFAEFGIAGGCVVGALLLFVLVCGASLTVTMTPRRAEPLRLQGAGALFICRPDAWRCAAVFLASALAALAASQVIASRMAASVTEAFGLYGLPVAFEPLPPAWQAAFAAGTCLLGAFLGGFNSLLESRKP